MDALPTPRTTDHKFWAGVCERLDRQNELLADIRDRLPAQRERAGQPARGDVEITEPDTQDTLAGSVPLSEPATPTKRPRTRKPAEKKTTTPRTRAASKKGTQT